MRVPAVHRSSLGGLRDGRRLWQGLEAEGAACRRRDGRAAADGVAGGVGRVAQGEAAGRRWPRSLEGLY